MEESGWFRLMIRILEIMLCSIIPSALCLLVLIIIPNVMLWKILCVIAFALCAVSNGFLWYWDNVNVMHDPISYFVVNTAAYAVFAAMAYICYKYASMTVYTAGFASTRAFEEVFVLRISRSMAVSHIILLTEMTLIYFFGYAHFLRNHAPSDDAEEAEETDDTESFPRL